MAKKAGGYMIVLQIAMYILFITFLVFIATRMLWLVFFLFCYRTLSGLVTFQWVQQHTGIDTPGYYTIFILILTAAIYFAIVIASNAIGSPILKYVFLIIMMLYTFATYKIEDVLFFRDFFESKDMWGWDFWKNQIKELFTVSTDKKEGFITQLFQNFWDGFIKFWGFFANLFQK